MNATKIEWCDFTSNPVKFRDASGKVVWGCEKVSPGCVHCYAESLAKRYGRGGPFDAKTMRTLTPFLDEKELKTLLRSKELSGKRVFVGDMTDVFGEWVSDELIERLFWTFTQRPDVVFQVLTKRAARLAEFWKGKFITPNIWLGVSVEDRKRLDERAMLLSSTPAAVRFWSVEPLLEDLGNIRGYLDQNVDWVIIGGESGPGARASAVIWYQSIVKQCREKRKPVFVKQLGARPMAQVYSPFTGEVVGIDRYGGVNSAKGNKPKEWPVDLRVREFPSPQESIQ